LSTPTQDEACYSHQSQPDYQFSHTISPLKRKSAL
jgi:hypothetical protein